jgi:tetratricopeptide (TPR) repeat protein
MNGKMLPFQGGPAGPIRFDNNFAGYYLCCILQTMERYVKRICTLALIAACVLPAGAAERDTAAAKEGPPRDSVNSDWSRYSWGLHYKNLALRERSAAARKPLLETAIRSFNEAAAAGSPVAATEYQLAECYYYLNDQAASLEHARKSLAADNSDLRVYNRIYSIKMKLKKPDEAAAVLEDYLRLNPDSVQVRYFLAEHYNKNMQDLDRAAAEYRAVIEKSDRQPIEDYYKEQSLFGLAGIAYRKGEVGEAIARYRQVLDMNRDSLEALYYLALTSMEIYDLDGAERYALEYQEKRPGNQTICSILGRVYYLRADRRALTWLGQGKGGGSLSGILAWGLHSELLRKDEEAERLLASVQKYAPRTISLHLALARLAERKGDGVTAFNEYVTAGVLLYNGKLYGPARRCLTEAARLNASVPGVYYYLGKAHEDDRHLARALCYYMKADRLQSDVDLMLHIGYLYGVKKEYGEAFRYFNRASALEPGNSRPFFFKGLVAIWQEDYPAAEKHFGKAIALDDKSETYYFYQAVAMEKQSKIDRAIGSLEMAIRQNPNSARACNYLGYLYADNNMKIEESLSLVLRALELEPGNGAYTDSLGWIYYRKGEFRIALEKLLAAEEILRKENNPDPVVYDHIGDTYLRMGNVGDALKYWIRSNEMKKSGPVEKKINQYRNR